MMILHSNDVDSGEFGFIFAITMPLSVMVYLYLQTLIFATTVYVVDNTHGDATVVNKDFRILAFV